MNYELAKKLKDAGFPQKSSIFRPSLSDLIEACGEEFGALHKLSEAWEGCGGRYEPMDQDCSWQFQIKGDTPGEAVANLWLALNEKHTVHVDPKSL